MNNVSSMSRRFAAVAVAAAFATAGFMAAGAACAHAATANVKASVANGAGYSKAVASGKTAGAAKASAKAMTGVKISLSGVKGTVTYKLSSATAYAQNKNGKIATPGAAAQTLSVSLSGAAKKKCDVYYRAYTPGYGWLGWAKNGEAAGTKVANKYISAIQVKLTAKNKALSAYKSTKSVACVSDSGFYNGLTGDAATDAMIAALAKKGGTLEGAFDAFNKKMSYAATDRAELGYAYPAKRLVTEGKAAFAKGKGDCYTYTAGFTYVARFMGYDAAPVAGKLKNKLGVYNPNSWCSIVNGDRTEIWNPQLQDSVAGDGDVFVKQNKLVLGDDGKPVKDANGNYVYEMGDDGKAKQYTICIRTYGFTKDEVNDYSKTFESKVFTGYGYATSAAEEI